MQGRAFRSSHSVCCKQQMKKTFVSWSLIFVVLLSELQKLAVKMGEQFPGKQESLCGQTKEGDFVCICTCILSFFRFITWKLILASVAFILSGQRPTSVCSALLGCPSRTCIPGNYPCEVQTLCSWHNVDLFTTNWSKNDLTLTCRLVETVALHVQKETCEVRLADKVTLILLTMFHVDI